MDYGRLKDLQNVFYVCFIERCMLEKHKIYKNLKNTVFCYIIEFENFVVEIKNP